MSDKKVVSIEDRIPKLKQARKKKANRRLIFYLSIFFFLVLIIVYLQSPLSYVKNIHVKGNAIVSENELIERSGLTDETNIWMINKGDIKESIHEHPMIETVSVKRMLPRDVEISVKEFALVGFVKENDVFSPVLEDGSILNDMQKKNVNGGAPLLVNFTKDDYLNKMATELHELPKSILNMISEVHWQPTEENENKILLYMNDGYIVKSTLRDFSDKMTVYPSIVSQLDPEDKGIIHIEGGAYFESFDHAEE